MSSLITDDAGLKAACDRWSATGLIGLDTEFFRERTYYPLPGLVQVAHGKDVTLVDPVGLSDCAPLAGLLADPSVVTLMHAPDEDLDVLGRLTGVMPRGVWDTQLAGAFTGCGFAASYASLVEVLLDVVLDKGLTRSDWLKRPLSTAQLHYAALDVTYLSPMYERLSSELATLGRVDWFEEELGHRRRAWATAREPESAYLRVRGRGALRPERHAVLRALSHWREIEAMARDIPRRHLVADDVLLRLASEPERDAASLKQVAGLSDRIRRRYGQDILTCMATARAEGPAVVDAPPNLRPYADTLTRLKGIVRNAAETLDLPPELVASRRALEALLVAVVTSGREIPPEFQGWRYEVVTKALLDVIQT